jgi:hypothetical protein
MALSKHDQATIREYLLGHLSEDAQERLEERLMIEDDLFEELEISKGELVDDYRAGEFTREERHWFEQHYLASPEGRQHHVFALALDCVEIPGPAPKPLTFFERVGSIFERQRWVFATASAAALVLIVAGVLFFRTGPQESLAFTLTSSATRRGAGDTQIHRITLNSNLGELRISLKLPEPPTPGTKYRAELDDRREIQNVKLAGQDADSVLVTIPARQLMPGYYALRLFAIEDDGTEQQIPGDYFFLVEQTN